MGGEARVVRAIERASRDANSYILAAGLDTPVTDPNAVLDLQGPILDISRYLVYDNPSEAITARYKNAIDWLVGLGTGRNRLRVAEKETRKSGFHNVRLVRS
ncbi:phage protein Gp36 family protein [Pseudomonas shirazensis]|uniref:phage protein Gp36 family protein n=1 Tax=Pseudomonas shirazensis TaxID=2745494 RepID=UPI003D2E27E2